METDYFNGEIVRIAHQHGITAPLNAALARASREAVRNQLGPSHLFGGATLRTAGHHMTDGPDRAGGSQLERRLGTADAVVMGLGSMVGAGVFAALAPAAAAAGSGLLIGLAGAGVVAYFNATSTARCAARYPESGGAYVYGRRRLGEFWGYLAGWGFVVGKTASCAAIALIVGSYAWPAHAHAIAVGAVLR